MKVKQGDSSDLETITHKIDGVAVTDYTDYLLHLEVIHAVTKENAGILRTITPGDDGFTIGLTPGDTAGLDVGEYLIVADLSKIVEGVLVFNRELSWMLRITASLRN